MFKIYSILLLVPIHSYAVNPFSVLEGMQAAVSLYQTFSGSRSNSTNEFIGALGEGMELYQEFDDSGMYQDSRLNQLSNKLKDIETICLELGFSADEISYYLGNEKGSISGLRLKLRYYKNLTRSVKRLYSVISKIGNQSNQDPYSKEKLSVQYSTLREIQESNFISLSKEINEKYVKLQNYKQSQKFINDYKTKYKKYELGRVSS